MAAFPPLQPSANVVSEESYHVHPDGFNTLHQPSFIFGFIHSLLHFFHRVHHQGHELQSFFGERS